jgi:hypothetical protein
MNVIKELNKEKNAKRANSLKKLFKSTGNDIFIGVPVPVVRKIVSKHKLTTTLDDIKKLLKSNIHEQKNRSIITFSRKIQT